MNKKIILGEVINYLYQKNQHLFEMFGKYLVKKYNKNLHLIINDVNIIKQDFLSVLEDIPYFNYELSLYLAYFFINDELLDENFPEICLESDTDIDAIFSSHKDFILDNNHSLELRYSLFYDLLIRMFQKNQDVTKLREPYLKLLDEIKEKIDFQKQDNVTNDKRIFIYTVQYLEATAHAPSNMVRILAEQFDKIGYQVIIVSCTPLPFPYKLKVGHSSFNQNSIALGDLAELYENTFIIELSGNPLRDNIYQDFCNQLQLNKNDTFITINERCIPFDILPFNRKFLLPSSANIDVTTANVLLANIDLNVINLDNKKLEFIFVTNDFTLSDDIVFTIKPIKANEKIKLVMVGNRLQNEIDETLWNGLISLYKKNTNIEVVIVGTFDESLIPGALKSCVTCAGYQYDLKEFLKNMHFYINPTRNGGGQSALLAVKLGIPVLTIDFGDVASVINHLYCLESFLEIENFVNNYLKNSEFKKEIDSYNEKLYNQSKKDSNSLLETCMKVIEYGNK